MTTQDLQELGQLPTIVASHRDAATVISRATSRIRHCIDTKDMDKLVSLLEIRSKALALVASFDAALRDAAVIQSLNTLSAIGYQCAGDVYLQQGRQLAAINEFTKGLENMAVPDSQLERSLHVAKEHLSKKMDHISLLPEEVVVTNIIPRLMGHQTLHSSKPCPYLYVSRIWRERVLQYDHLSFRLSRNSKESDTADEMQQHAELIRFAPFTESLHVGQKDGKGPWHILSQASFHSLRKLYIKGDAFNWHDPGSLSALRMIGDGLTHLEIDIWHGMTMKFEDILELCPNLVSCTLGGGVALDTSSLCNHVYPKLIHLAIRNLYVTLPQESLEAIYKAFPSLTKLLAKPAIDTRPLALISQYCPRLQWITLQSGFLLPLIGHINGIRHALILQFRRQCYMEDVVSLVRAHAEQLELLNLMVRSMNDVDISTQNDIQFPQLAQLALHSTEHYHAGFSTWVISNAPNLRYVRLIASAVQSKTLDCLISLQHLNRMELRFEPDSCDQNYHQALERLLQHHVRLGTRSTLEKLSLFNVLPSPSSSGSVIPSWLYPVAHLVRLRMFALMTQFDMDASFVSFMEALAANCVALEDIEVTCDHGLVAEGVIAPLQQLKNLKSIAIYCNSLPEHDVLQMQNCPALECLSIDMSGNAVSQSTKDALSASIKEVCIT